LITSPPLLATFHNRDIAMKLVTAIITTLLLSACTAMPNNISASESSFDGSTQYRMEPGIVYGDNFSMGVNWNTKMGDRLIFNVERRNVIMNIDSRDALLFNIDGEVVALSSPDLHTEFDSHVGSDGIAHRKSSKRFYGSISLLDRLLSADSVKVKVHLDMGK